MALNFREVRRGSIDVAHAAGLAREAAGWGVQADDQTWTAGLAATLTLSLSHGLPAYDAAYLELCLRRGPPLATFDAKLRNVALSLGVESLR